MRGLKAFFAWLTFASWRAARSASRRRANYEFLKARISERHFAGYKGLVVDFPDQKFDLHDIGCFKAPMYYAAMNKDGHWCIFWDHARLTREIGTGAPLKAGESMIPDTLGRTKPQGTVETIDEQSPLVIQEATHGQDASSAPAPAPEARSS